MQSILEKIIRYDSESPILDYKEIQYSLENVFHKNELLKDVSAMANYPGDQDRFIMIGVVEENGLASTFRDIGALVDEANYQQLIHSNIEPKINFEYKQFVYQETNLAYFRIFNNSNRPYLFKRDLQSSSAPQKVEYKMGDGFIRHGTSTRKMVRDDFEVIYSDRLTQKDRKQDVSVTVYCDKCTDEELEFMGLHYLDIELKNTSNKSIHLDAEMTIFTSPGLSIVAENELRRRMEEKRNELHKYSAGIRRFISATPTFSFDVSIQHSETWVIVSRIKRHGERTALAIAQNDSDPNVFCSNAVIIAENPVLIKGEILLRSDDFTGGPLVVPFEIDYIPDNS